MTVQTEISRPTQTHHNVTDENIFSVIRNRRATREYSSKQVSDEIIQSLVEFSIQAPSAMNLQPWSFVIIQNSKILNEISEQTKKKLFNHPEFAKYSHEHGLQFLSEPDFDIFYGAPSLIVICAKTKGAGEFSAEADCFLAGENLMLAATGMGLATCPIGLARDVLHEPAMSKKLGIPSDFIPVLPIVVGYASASVPHVDRNPPSIRWVR